MQVILRDKFTQDQITIYVDVDESSFEEAQREGDGMYYIADKGSLLFNILDQCVVEYVHNGQIIQPTGSF